MSLPEPDPAGTARQFWQMERKRIFRQDDLAGPEPEPQALQNDDEEASGNQPYADYPSSATMWLNLHLQGL
jgi:hypothetical protein